MEIPEGKPAIWYFLVRQLFWWNRLAILNMKGPWSPNFVEGREERSPMKALGALTS
jgi:hypothetical protein